MIGRIPLAVGAFTASAATAVLLAWSFGWSEAPRLVTGWRVMVPSSAFSFLCTGVGLMAAARLGSADALVRRAVVRMLALFAFAMPAATLVEYGGHVRIGIERWLGGAIGSGAGNPYAGRMSPMTSLCFVLLAVALAALTWPGRWASSAVRAAGGAALAVSWFAVLAISFDEARISDQPQFPGMAALTIVLFAVTSYGVLAASNEAVARVRESGTDVALHAGLVVSAFALPLVLGPVTQLLSEKIAPELATAAAAVVLALALTIVVWRGLARMQDLQHERRAALADLENRVAARTGELGEANAQLRASEARLREANHHKDEFLAMLSHELRNPLAPIRTGVELLKGSETSPMVRAEVHRVVERQMIHLVRLIDDLLDVSRISAGKLAVDVGRLDMREVVEHAIEAVRPAAQRARHDLRLTMPPHRVEVEGDATRLAQVAANLVHNACKFTPPGGELSVVLRETANWVELRVRDNGVGIPAEFLTRVFDRFAQRPSGPNGASGGLGLGLALVQGIVTLHGGSVEAHSEGPQRGSEFVVRLPAPSAGQVSSPVDSAATDGPITPPVAESRRVLVVDDNADNTTALAMLLRQLGHEVEVADDGEMALARARYFRPDVILLDIGIPKMNGYDVCRELRQHDWGRRIRVIAQTGFGDEQDRRRSAEAGFDGHLVKPIDPARLGAVLQA
jgi:signal transduction histidine kinase